MKRLPFVNVVLLVVVLAFACSASLVAQDAAKKTMSNQDVIDMVGLGLGDELVISKIHASHDTKFDTELDAMKALKAAKVSDAVIAAMINPNPPAPVAAAPVAAAPVAPPDDPNLPPKEVGVYWRDGKTWVPIDGQNVSQAKIGGRMAHAFSYGIAAKHWNAYVQGPVSKNRVKDFKPIFYIYTMEGMAPTDYVILKLDKKGDRRQFEVGSVGGWVGGKSGVRESNMRSFKSERVALRTYKITLDQELKAGEYGFFMLTGQAMAMGNGETGGNAQGRIFDFTIPD
jgi:hypothetical protein